MNKQSEALRLADELEDAALVTGLSRRDHLDHRIDAATTIRRLSALNAELVEALKTAEACLYAHRKPIDPAITLALDKAEAQ